MKNNHLLSSTLPRGSTLYYAYSFLPAEKKENILPLLAFAHSIKKIPYECSEPDVARQKLAWWHREIDGWSNGQASHPITQALPTVDGQLLHEFIASIELNFKFQAYQRAADLVQHTHRLTYIPSVLIAQILNSKQEVNTLFLHHIGVVLGLFEVLDHSVEDLRKGRLYLPDEDLARFGLKHLDFNHAQHTEQKQALIAHECAEIKKFYELACKALKPEEKNNYEPWLIQAAIVLDILREMEKEGFQLLQHRVDLTPLRKWWLAWRVRAKALIR